MTDWFDTPHGWLMRHMMANGAVVAVEDAIQTATRIELLRAEHAARKAEELAERLRQRAEYEREYIEQRERSLARQAAMGRPWKALTPEQTKKRNQRMMVLRIVGRQYRQLGGYFGISGSRVMQILWKMARKNRWLIFRRKVTLDSYLFKAHGFGGRQYRLGA